MNRWIAALGNAIEASITGAASIRGGGSGSASPSLSSLASVDDLDLRQYASVSSSEQHSNGPMSGLGLGFPSPSGSEREAAASSGGGFPGLRGWGNDLSRKVSLRGRAKHLSHQPSPSESASSSVHGGQHGNSGFDSRMPMSAPGSSSGGRKRQHQRSQSVLPTSSNTASDGPRLNFISASPMGTPTQPFAGGHLLPPLEAPSRLSFESSGSDRSSASPSRSPSLLTDDIALHIDRFVTNLAAASSPDLSLGPLAGQPAPPGRFYGGGSSADRRAVSEGSEHPHHTPPPTPVLTIRSIAAQPANARCLDCERPNPRWATIGLNESPVVGFMCIECSGVHRSLGSHVSKVRSVELDNWRESDIAVAAATGNAYINAIWEAIPPRPEDRAKCALPLARSMRPAELIARVSYPSGSFQPARVHPAQVRSRALADLSWPVYRRTGPAPTTSTTFPFPLSRSKHPYLITLTLHLCAPAAPPLSARLAPFCTLHRTPYLHENPPLM
jgi:hypothetical protein